MKLGCIVLLTFAWACGDDSSATDAGSDAGSDAASDVATDTTTGGTDIEAIVYEGDAENPMSTTIADAQIAAVLPGGARVELVSDTSGMFVLEDVDFSRGSLSLSVWKDGYRVGGGLDITEIPADVEGPVPVFLLPLEEPVTPPTMITVSGTITGLAEGDFFSVTSDQGGFDQDSTASYSLEVPVGEPFNLFMFSWTFDPDMQPARGVEQDLFHSFVSIAHAGSDSDIVVDVELPADPDLTQVQEITGSMLLPETGRFREMGGIFPRVFARSFRPFLGAATRSAISSDGTRVEYTIKYVQPDYVDEVVTSFRFGMGAGEASQIFTTVPPEGDSDLQFLNPVDVTTPAFGVVPSVYDEVVYEDDGGANTSLALLDENRVLGYLVVPEGEPGTRAIMLPAPPTGFDASQVLGAEEITARIQHCAADEELPGFCAVFTNSRGFGVMP